MTTGTPPPTHPARPPRSRLLRLLPLAVAAWLVLEIWLLIEIGSVAGGLTVFLLLVAGFVLGAAVIKRAGRRAFQNLSETLQRQQRGEQPMPPEQGGGNGLVMLGGLLLMMPGVLSDALGLLCLLPPVRGGVSRYAQRAFERRVRQAPPGSFEDAYQQSRMHRPDGKVVPGEVIKNDERPQDDAPRPDDGPRPPLTP
ncbi:FxsA family membrane protein [Streptomyces apocyni]|uniref:FxsA family membrane protein n=1 Tax=Streptomyces apocyni TaxID=2654677 RepID=UPI0012EA88C8|nr:FxsA family membrane protein [Streptomyces apocyni]